ncbi:MAG: class I lanthipeptide [Thermoanaerobaculia bacterium]
MIMKKKSLKKLHLAKETLGSMLDSELSRIVGGLRSYLDTCPVKCTTSDYAPGGVDTLGG